MKSYKSPNVYIEEIATLPPSVVAGATAVPAFIGYTEKAGNKIGDSYEYDNKPIRITNMIEYENIFGKAYFSNGLFDFELTQDKDYKISLHRSELKFLLYYQLQMYFANGGGVCYIVSAGQYGDSQVISVDRSKIENCLNELKKEDEPTLIILTDAVMLEALDYYAMCQLSLQQCEELKDRFTIIDVSLPDNLDTQGQIETIQDFRTNIGQNNLKYGAAYYPYLNTNLNYIYDDAQVNNIPLLQEVEIKLGPVSQTDTEFVIQNRLLTINIAADATTEKIVTAWNDWILSNDRQGYNITGDDNQVLINVTNGPIELTVGTDPNEKSATIQDKLYITCSTQETTLDSLRITNSQLYATIKAELGKLRVTLPPSGAIAGIYSTTDRERGIWKAPANTSINYVIEPTIKVTDLEQDDLNVHDSGKSINVIRGFTGKGTLVWGARTLAGNDNEWRYIPVRRLFCLIEKSIKSSISFAVFEPNTEMTWLKVRVMIESYLNELWSQGALAGSKAEDAYFVEVGLGKTMTSQDILEGRMITKIGIAAVRPAEFIIVQFSHLLQKS